MPGVRGEKLRAVMRLDNPVPEEDVKPTAMSPKPLHTQRHLKRAFKNASKYKIDSNSMLDDNRDCSEPYQY